MKLFGRLVRRVARSELERVEREAYQRGHDDGYDEGCADAESEASERMERVREDGERRERYAREEAGREERWRIERNLESQISHDSTKDYFERRREIGRIRSAVR